MSLLPILNDELIQQRMQEVEKSILKHYPDLIHAWKASLAVIGCGVIGNPYRCIALVFVGEASSGKSTVVESFYAPDPNVPYAEYFFRDDKFTPASFVSHSSSAKDEEALQKIDLLPKLKNRTLLTSELAPMFQGNKNDLTPRFDILTRVLDGKGLLLSSGVWGQRGHVGEFVFQWLGCTTPLDTQVVAAMSRLGPRLVFYNVNRPWQDGDAAFDFLRSNQDGAAIKEICDAIQKLVGCVYQKYGRRTGNEETGVDRTSIKLEDNEELGRLVTRWAEVACCLRTTMYEAKPDKFDDDEDPQKRLSQKRREFINRLAEVFIQFTVGSSIMHGRNKFTDYEVKQVGHIALSTGMPGRSDIFEQALRRGGVITSTEAREYCERKTNGIELRYMRELELAGLGEVSIGHQHIPTTFTVDERFKVLCDYMLPSIVHPPKRRKVKRA